MNPEVLNFYSGQAVPVGEAEYHEGYYYDTTTHEYVASNTYSCMVIKLDGIPHSIYKGPFAAFALLDVVKQPDTYYGDAKLLFIAVTVQSDTILRNITLYNASQGNDRLYSLPSTCNVIIINKVQIKPKDMYLVYKHDPLYSSCVKNYKKENDQIFMRESLSTDAKYVGSDYQYFKSLAMDSANFFCITRNSSTSIYVKGEFSKVDCKFDISKRQCTIDVRILDMYSQILNKYSEQIDVIKLNPQTSTIGFTKEAAIQVYTSGSETVTTLVGGQWTEDELDGDAISTDPGTLGNNYSAQQEAYTNFKTLQNRNFGSTQFFNEFTVTGCTGTDSQGGNLSRFNGTYFGKCPYYGAIPAGTTATFLNINNPNLAIRLTNYYPIGNSAYIEDETQLYDVQLVDLAANLVCYENSHYTEFRLKCRFPWDGSDHTTTVYFNYIYSNTCQYNGATATTGSGNYARIAITLYQNFYRMLSDDGSVGGTTVSVKSGDRFIPRNKYNYAYIRSFDFLHPYHSAYDFGYSISDTDDITRYPRSTITNKFFTRIKSSAYDSRVVFPLCPSCWHGVAMWGTIASNDYETFISAFKKAFTFNNAYSIATIIRLLLKSYELDSISFSEKDSSVFLYSNSFPVSLQKGIDSSVGMRLYLTPSSNLLANSYSEAARTGKISLKDILDMLRNLYNCYWFIDENSILRVEHIKYFMNGLSYSGNPAVLFDFTNEADAYNGQNVIFDQYQIEYVKQGFFSKRTIEFSNTECSQAFNINVLKYLGYFLRDSDESDISISRFDADITDMQAHGGEDYSKDNFVLIASEMIISFGYSPLESGCPSHILWPGANNLFFKDSDGMPTPVVLVNAFASPLVTMQFMLYNVPSLTSYEIEGPQNITPQTQLRFMSQKIEVSLTQDLEYLGLVHTDLGDGMIMDMQVDMVTRKAKLELRYFPV